MTSTSLLQASYLPPGQQSINLLYETLLGREGDAPGLAVMENAVSAGASLRDIASGIALSPEFINGNGSLSDSGFIESMYTNELGRHSDADGFSLIQQALLSGASRADVAVGIAGSYEAQSAHATLPFVQANNLYHTLLGRDMDTQGGTSAVGVLLRGAALSDLAGGMMSSPEYFSWQTSTDTVSLVSSFYTYGLGRAPSGTETAFYVQAVGAGATIAQVAGGIASSPEALRFAGYGPVGSLTV